MSQQQQFCNLPAYMHPPSDDRQLCDSSLPPLFAAVLAQHSPAHKIHDHVKVVRCQGAFEACHAELYPPHCNLASLLLLEACLTNST